MMSILLSGRKAVWRTAKFDTNPWFLAVLWVMSFNFSNPSGTAAQLCPHKLETKLTTNNHLNDLNAMLFEVAMINFKRSNTVQPTPQ
jgi:hypothetical protein